MDWLVRLRREPNAHHTIGCKRFGIRKLCGGTEETPEDQSGGIAGIEGTSPEDGVIVAEVALNEPMGEGVEDPDGSPEAGEVEVVSGLECEAGPGKHIEESERDP